MSDWATIAIQLEEFLNADLRPSFIVDLGSFPSETPHVCFRNPSCSTSYACERGIAGDSHHKDAAFANWAFHHDSKSLLPTFHYHNLTWVATTLRHRWRVIQASSITSDQQESGTLSPESPVAQFEHLNTRRQDYSKHDWTAAEPPAGLSAHAQTLREWDWGQTEYGPIENWSPLLRTMANLVVANPNLGVIWWGPNKVALYNEPFVAIIQDKHPNILGRPYAEMFAELYSVPETASILEGYWQKAFEEGKAIINTRVPWFIRNGPRLVEWYFDFTLLPIIENGETVGVYEYLTDASSYHVNKRRSDSLKKIAQSTAHEEDPDAFFKSVATALSDNDKDFPFALFYSMGPEIRDRTKVFSPKDGIDNTAMRLESFLGLPMTANGLPVLHNTLISDESFLEAMTVVCTSSEVLLFDLENRPDIKAQIMEDTPIRGYGAEPYSAILCPIAPTTHKGVIAVMILGVNPRRPFNEEYHEFARGLARSISVALASVLLVHEQKRLAGKAVEMEQRAMAMIDVSPVGSFLMDVEGTVLYANEQWFNLSNHQGEFYPKSWLPLVSEEHHVLLMTAWNDLVEKSIPFSIELKLRHDWVWTDPATGETITGPAWIYAQAILKKIADNTFVTGAITDISRQKWAECFQVQQKLEAVELKRQQENFMDLTSHEMRMATLMEFQQKYPLTSPHMESITYAIEAAGIITMCAQHQKRIVDDVLVLSKVDAKLIEISPIDVEVVVLIQNVVKMFGAELAANDIHMSFELSQSFHDIQVDWVRLDPGRLLQVLINLCTNAIKFTAGSETREIVITMGASTERPIESSSRVQYFHREGDQDFDDPTIKSEWGCGEVLFLRFQVADSGRGISEEEMRLLFQRFTQTSPRTHTQYGGSGLGLFIARLLSRLQGGEIGATSSPGCGSTFAFYIKVRRSDGLHSKDGHPRIPQLYLPVDHAHEMSSSLRVALPSADFTILVVEDNLVNQRVLSKQLTNLGFVVAVANNGQESLDFLRSSEFWRGQEHNGRHLSIILMDIEMPIMNGTEAARQIRLFEVEGLLTSHVPIIAITANARNEQIARAMESGMDALVSKPFRIPDLLEKIEVFVGPLSLAKAKNDAQKP